MLFAFVVILLLIIAFICLIENIYELALMLLSLIVLLGYTDLREVRQLEIFEDTMLIKYIGKTVAYKSEEIETIKWITTIARPYLRLRYFQLAPVLLIQARNGKKIKIPPPGEKYDIEKKLLAWRSKYNNQKENQAKRKR